MSAATKYTINDLCQDGKALYKLYYDESIKHKADDAKVILAHDIWIRHIRGCTECLNGIDCRAG